MTATINPIRCAGADIATPQLLTAKLLALTLLINGEFRQITPPFLPFFSFFDALPPIQFQYALRGIFFVAAFGLLFNRRARGCCVVLAATILISILAARDHFTNTRVFVAALLAMIGLEQTNRGGTPRFLRWQIALVYVGAALNKLLDPDWRYGIFMDNFITAFGMDSLRHVAQLFPPMILARVLSWGTIAIEAALSILWWRGAWPMLTIFAVLSFHCTLTAATGYTFGHFYFAYPIACLTLARWPSRPGIVFYDGDCGLCGKVRAFFERLDADHNFQWKAFQSSSDRFGISKASLRERLHVVVDGRVYAGFRAFKMLILLNPLFYFVCLLLLLLLASRSSVLDMTTIRWPFIPVVIAATFLPLVEPFGERVYRAVADNRHRSSTACRLPTRNTGH